MPAAILVFADVGAGPAIADRLESSGYEVHKLDADKVQRHEIANAVSEVADRTGAELLVNNAPQFAAAPALEIPPSSFSAALDIGLHSMFSACREAARSALEGGRSLAIVNVVSAFGMVGLEGRVSDACVAAGVLAATKALAAEWGPMGFRASTVVVGPTDAWLSSEGSLDDIPGVVPLGHTVGAEDVAHMVLLAASAQSSSSTGQPFIVDAGWLANGWRRE